MNARVVVVVALAVLAAGAAPASAGSYGTELPFTAGVGARASGMGLAVSSIPGSPSSLYFNPALIARHERQQIEFFRTTLYDSDAQYHAVSYVYPTLDYGSLGISVLRVGVGGVEQRDEFNNLLNDNLENGQTRILLGYAASPYPLLSAGFNLKIDRQSFGDFSGTGVGADVGLLVHRDLAGYSPLESWRAGLAIENLMEPSIKLDQEDVPDPMQVTLGGSIDGRFGDVAFVTALDLVSPRNSPFRARAGEEIAYGDVFAFRFGFDGSTPTAGLSGSYRGIAMDYAFRDEELGANHRVSLSVAFGPSADQRRAHRHARLDAELQNRVSEKMKEYENSQLRALVADADSMFEAAQYDQARRHYEMVLLWEPSVSRAQERVVACRRNIGIHESEALAGRGDYLAALQQIRRTLLVVPNDAELLARASEYERKIDAAKDRSRMIENTLTSSIELYAQDRLSEARVGFLEVLRIDADNQIALEYERKCSATIDSNVRRLLAKARAQTRRGEFDAAVESLEHALVYRPGDPILTREIEDIGRQRRGAIAAAERTTPPAPEPAPQRTGLDTAELDDSYERGLREFERGRFEEASALLMRVWSVAPDYRGVADPLTRSYLYLGMKLYSEGGYADAIRVWEKILAVDPNNVKARRYLDKSREEASKLTGGNHD